MDETVRLVFKTSKLWWYYLPNFDICGPFYDEQSAKKALEGSLMKEDLNEC